MAIALYNTLTATKEPLVTVEPGTVKIYSCGPTVYDYFHIGNSRAFVVPDVLKRYLRFRGYRVVHVQNITDIEDKIIRRANEMGVTFQDVVDKYTKAFLDDLTVLGCVPADVQPKATAHISQIITLINSLIERGLAYAVDGDVYYDVSRFEPYGRLSKQSLEELQSGARVAVDERKQDPLDFALWKAAKPGEPSWPSPWGEGRPGWHIECSAMSMQYLGETFDIHTGGTDLVFPHHENEIAQSEGATGHPFVRFWLHNGYINIDGAKMSKSLGNFFTFRELAERFDPEALRLFLISKQYRTPIDFTEDAVTATARGLSRLRQAVAALHEALGRPWQPATAPQGPGRPEGAGIPESAGTVPNLPLKTWPDQADLSDAGRQLYTALENAYARFISAMDDDLNTPIAVACLFDLARESNRFLQIGEPVEESTRRLLESVADAFSTLAGVLGILARRVEGEQSDGAGTNLTNSLVELLITLRQDARRRKDWTTADAIRDKLAVLDIVLEDGAHGTRWKIREADGPR